MNFIDSSIHENGRSLFYNKAIEEPFLTKSIKKHFDEATAHLKQGVQCSFESYDFDYNNYEDKEINEEEFMRGHFCKIVIPKVVEKYFSSASESELEEIKKFLIYKMGHRSESSLDDFIKMGSIDGKEYDKNYGELRGLGKFIEQLQCNNEIVESPERRLLKRKFKLANESLIDEQIKKIKKDFHVDFIKECAINEYEQFSLKVQEDTKKKIMNKTEEIIQQKINDEFKNSLGEVISKSVKKGIEEGEKEIKLIFNSVYIQEMVNNALNNINFN